MRLRLYAFLMGLAWSQVASAGDGLPIFRLSPADVGRLPSARSSFPPPEHPAISYATRPTSDVVAQLNKKIEDGTTRLAFESTSGYLLSLLEALGISIDSQILVFSKTSLQRGHITPKNPRAIYFNDTVAVTFIRSAPLIEVAVQDPVQGMIFYDLPQDRSDVAPLMRNPDCVACHLTRASMGMPGTLNRSVAVRDDGVSLPYLGNYVTTHSSLFAQRWGGSYITGLSQARHMGNQQIKADGNAAMTDQTAPALHSIGGLIDLAGYPSDKSDAAARLVFDHQMHMMDLITRVGWDTRVALFQEQPNSALMQNLLKTDARELVDYLLFIDEAPFTGTYTASNAFAKTFAAQGPRDRRGRSLRDLDLKTRLMRFPCSYMIYSAAFDRLPPPAKEAIYARMWEILSGAEQGAQYGRLRAVDRRAIIDILRDTKPDLPAYFK